MTLEACLALLLLLLAGTRCGDARVRLNSIRTVILRESHVLPVNQSAWEPRVDLTLLQCMSDLECSEGSYCHAPSTGPAHSRCQTCRRRKRRCHRDGMCCPGNRCSNSVCVADGDSFASQHIGDSEEAVKTKGWRRRGKAGLIRGQVGDPCLRSSDCSASLCCARHFWTRICKPVLMEGQVCSRQRRKAQPGLELFQRCACGPALACRALAQPAARPAPSLLATAKSRFVAPGRHAPPGSPAPAPRTRLHVCQRN